MTRERAAVLAEVRAIVKNEYDMIEYEGCGEARRSIKRILENIDSLIRATDNARREPGRGA